MKPYEAEFRVRRGDVEAIIPALQDKNKKTRRIAAEGLGDLKDPRAVDPLVESVLNGPNDVWKYAMSSLIEIGDPSCVPPLCHLIKDRGNNNIDKMHEAISTLGYFKVDSALQTLIELMADDLKSVRREAVNAIGEMEDSRANEALILSLSDDNQKIRKTAADILSRTGDVKTISVLEKNRYPKEARRLRFNLCAQAIDTTNEVRSDMATLQEKKEKGEITRSDLEKVKKDVDRLKKAKMIAETTQNTEVLQQVQSTMKDLMTLQPTIQTVVHGDVVQGKTGIYDSVVSKTKIGDSTNFFAETEKLIQWRKEGLLTQEEFEAAKAKLLR